MPRPTIYVVTAHAPGCLPDDPTHPHLITTNEDEAITAYEDLANDLAYDFYLADLDEIHDTDPYYSYYQEILS